VPAGLDSERLSALLLERERVAEAGCPDGALLVTPVGVEGTAARLRLARSPSTDQPDDGRQDRNRQEDVKEPAHRLGRA
jgi:hypothetical protein